MKWTPRFDFGGGSSELLIVVECRDRGRLQDVTWIEQLISKKRSIGADVVIAVCSSDLTAPAKEKAAKYAIRTRRIRDITPLDVSLWARQTRVDPSLILFPIRKLFYQFCDAEPDTRALLSSAFSNELNRRPLDAPVLQWGADRRPLTLRQLLCWYLAEAQELDDNERPARWGLALQFPEADIFVPTIDGERTVSQLNVFFDVEFVPTSATLDRVVRYSGETGPITDRAEYSFPVGDGHVIVGIGRPPAQNDND